MLNSNQRQANMAASGAPGGMGGMSMGGQGGKIDGAQAKIMMQDHF